MSTLKPLQTHGLYDEIHRWFPPYPSLQTHWPYVKYDEHDEVWLRPFVREGDDGRYGRIKTFRSLKELYDVRLMIEPNTLVGYSNRNPVVTMNHQRDDRLRLPVIDSFEIVNQFRPMELEMNTAKFREIVVHMRKFSIHGEHFLSWFVQPEDAPALAECGFINGYGPDNIYQFANDMTMKYHDFHYRFMRDTRFQNATR